MPQFVDARGNEFLGSLDQIGGGTFTDARVSSATLGAANAELVMDLNGHDTATFDLRSGALSATLVFEGTLDGTNYIGLPALAIVATTGQAVPAETYMAAVVTTSTLNGQYVVKVGGFRRVRVRISAYTSGNVVAFARASRASFSMYMRPLPAIPASSTAAVNTALTATLPAPGAGLFHYVASIRLTKLYSVVGVAAGAGVIVTTTNMPGSLAWTTEQLASPAGTAAKVIDESYQGNPLKSSVANTATTFVAPAQLQTIWRWNISYYVGA